jgi:hypothetical protein
MEQTIQNVELVKVVITSAGNAEFKLPQTSNIEGHKIVGIETYKHSELPVTVDGLATLNDNALLDAFISINDGSKEVIQNLPLRKLVSSLNSGILPAIKPTKVDSAKCTLKFGQTSHLVADEVCLIVFYYE